MAEPKRDRSVGEHWLAWWALAGDEDIAFAKEYFAIAFRQLEKIGELDKDGEEIIANVRLFLIALAEAADPSGKSEFVIEFKRRKAGKPINAHQRAVVGRGAAARVDRLVGEGWKQEAAIAQVRDDTKLSRAEIFKWLKFIRSQRRQFGLSP